MVKKYLIAMIALTYTLPVVAGSAGGWVGGLLVATLFFGGWLMWLVLLLLFAAGGSKTAAIIRALAWPVCVFPASWVIFQLGESGVLDFRVCATDMGPLVYSFAVYVLYGLSVFFSQFVRSVANGNQAKYKI